MIPVYVGHDEREDIAYQVCRLSILAKFPGATVVPLKHRELRSAGLFWREWRIDGQGQYWDAQDGKPFSTQFSHTRFLVPYLARRDFPQADWAMFVDCDFMFRESLKALFGHLSDHFAMMCVKHQQRPTEHIKMDGVKQTAYPRKNWSSLMLFNLAHNQRLTPECVSEADGAWLHQFEWLSEEQIGSLPVSWNHLATISPELPFVHGVHFTLGGPWFEDWPRSDYDDEWIRYASEVRYAPPAGLRASRAAE